LSLVEPKDGEMPAKLGIGTRKMNMKDELEYAKMN
jgi:hypothetical protein